jgi:excisionase family DNA binding protein
MELWSLQEVAKCTGTSVAFWRKQVLLRQIPVVKVGRLVRLNREHVLAYLACRTRPAAEAPTCALASGEDQVVR